MSSVKDKSQNSAITAFTTSGLDGEDSCPSTGKNLSFSICIGSTQLPIQYLQVKNVWSFTSTLLTVKRVSHWLVNLSSWLVILEKTVLKFLIFVCIVIV
jgi:hypothetical protein